jgi:AAHS family 3-hydroxyphenylpropionic acid transporter
VFAASFRRLNLGAWLSFLAISYVAYAFAAWGTVFLTQAGLALPAALQALLGFNLAAVIMAITTGFIVTARGSAVVMRHGSLATWVACGLMWLALQPETQAAGWQTLGVRVAAVLAGAATGAVLASLYTVLANAYPPSCRGFGIGLGMLLGRGGAIASTYTGGMLLASAGSSVTPLFLVLGGCAVLSLLGTALIDRHVLPAASRE